MRVDIKVNENTIKAKDPTNKLTEHQRTMKDIEEQRQVRKEIMAAGQDDRAAGMVEVEKQVRAEKAEEQKAAEDVMNKLDMKKKYYSSYQTELAKSLAELLEKMDWIKGWTADVLVTHGEIIHIKDKAFQTKEGLLLIVSTPQGEVFHQGMLFSMEPPIDYGGILTLAIQVENTMDKRRGLLLDGSPLSDPAKGGIVDAYGKPITGATS